jgi:hypothetical protein
MFVTGNTFQRNLEFLGKTQSGVCKCKLYLKYVACSNTLAYFSEASVNKKRILMTLRPYVRAIKMFSSVKQWQEKLGCLSLKRFSGCSNICYQRMDDIYFTTSSS